MATQIKDRTGWIGGSDIAAALGLSKYKTQLQLWAEKTGQVEPENVDEKIQVKLGKKLEPVVADLFEEATGKKIHRVNEPFVHKKYPFLRGQVDRRVVGEKSIVEIKTSSPYRLKEYKDEEMPIDYLLQTVFYMALSGADLGYLAVLFGNQDFKVKVIQKDKDLENDIIKKAVLFWETFVLPKVMPSVSRDDANTLYSLFPAGDEGSEIELGDEANKLIESLQGLKADRFVLEGEIDKTENSIKALLKDAAVGRTDKYVISWKNQVSQRIDSDKLRKDSPGIFAKFAKAVTSRVLRYRELNKND